MFSPTARSLAHLRKLGYVAEVVEKWIPRANIRKDLFGFIDIVAIGPKEVIGVQTTTKHNMAARVRKIEKSPYLHHVLFSGIKVRVHGWEKVGSRLKLTEVEIS